MNIRRRLAALLLLVGFADPNAQAQERLTVFISDFHMGLGRTAGGDWHPYEDFRWPAALKGFLTAVSKEGNDNVDLVIVGDFLELWQLPDDIQCRGTGPDAGCSMPELVDFVTRIIRAHRAEFDELRAFSVRGHNRLHVIPGNHDAALLIPEIWAPVADALGVESGRVVLAPSGLWRSADGRVLAEHGHQIGSDVNRFNNWPAVTTNGAQGERLMIRPWGERFVQEIFNREEARYPIIDNLSPETAGARYRLVDRGLWGSAADLARFVAFNVFETSLEQKVAVLGTPPAPGTAASLQAFDRDAAIQAGHQLFTSSMAADDPFRLILEGSDPAAATLRDELSTLATSLPEDELRMLCENAVVYSKKNLCYPTLTSMVVGAVVPKAAVFKKHLTERRRALGDFEVFVYGHTHQWERGWTVQIDDVAPVTVFNSGAFQRLTDETGFVQRARARGLSESEALRAFRPEDLAPCYTAVVVKHQLTSVSAELRLWEMIESGTGRFREPGVSDCN